MRPTTRWRGSGRSVTTARIVAVVTVVVVLVALGGCGTGSATIRIDQGEAIVDDTVREIADAIGLEVTSEVELGNRRPCDLPGTRDGASNTVSLQGPRPDVDDPLGVGASVLVDNGFELVDGGGPDIIFGRRAQMRITVDQGGDRISIDGATGCRPLPEG